MILPVVNLFYSKLRTYMSLKSIQEEEVMVRNVLMEKRRNLGRITWHEVQVETYQRRH
jgi:hypothetical protein